MARETPASSSRRFSIRSSPPRPPGWGPGWALRSASASFSAWAARSRWQANLASGVSSAADREALGILLGPSLGSALDEDAGQVVAIRKRHFLCDLRWRSLRKEEHL